MSGLYIHVPFCLRKCRYCDFYSLPLSPLQSDSAGPRAERFLDALAAELERLPGGFLPETIYIGGGTPTALPGPLILRLLEIVGRAVAPAQVREWTCEANPGTLDAAKVKLLREAGVNRVSLGVQSLDARNLAFLGRIHSAEDAETAFALLREQGLGNINLDLMYGIPDGGRGALERDLERILALGPEHVACYALSFEPGTPLAAMRDRGAVSETDDAEQLAQYTLIRETLAQAGFRHYEISNFARPSRECRHNLRYWRSGEYIGCGPSAHSHWRGARWGNVRDLAAYCERLLAGRDARACEEQLDPQAKAREALILGLRLIEGVGREEFRQQTGFDYMDLRGPQIDELCQRELLVEENGRLRLSVRALFVSDFVFRELV